MLDIYEKRTVIRIIGPNKTIKVKESPWEVIQNPVGVYSPHVLEAQTTMIRFLTNKINALDELLRTIVPEVKDGTEK